MSMTKDWILWTGTYIVRMLRRWTPQPPCLPMKLCGYMTFGNNRFPLLIPNA